MKKLLCILFFAIPSHAQNNPPTIQDETNKLVTLIEEYNRADGTEKAFMMTRVNLLAMLRAGHLSEVIPHNPSGFLQLAYFAWIDRSTLPDVPGHNIEQWEEDEGLMTVMGVSLKNRQTYPSMLYTLRKENGEYLEVYFSGSPPKSLVSKAKVKLKGVRLLNRLVVKSQDVQVEQMAAPAHSLGKQNTLVVLVNFTDKQEEPFTVESIEKLMFSDVASFIKEGSYSQASVVGDVAGWYTIEQSAKTCNVDDIAELSKEAAAQDGFNLDEYSRFFFMFPDASCDWWGLGEVGSPPTYSWINGVAPDDVISHEFGHNLGMIHTHSYDCGPAVLLPNPDTECIFNEYGDPYDNMGGSKMHYSAGQKEHISWLGAGRKSPPIHFIAKGKKTFTITPYARQDVKPKAIKIRRNDKQFYFVEYRQPIGYDKNILEGSDAYKGVLLHLREDDRNYLLDGNPDGLLTNDFKYAALKPKQSYQDSEVPLKIYVNSVNKNGATVTVTFNKK